MQFIYPVILSGGVGSRLWPLSRALWPKQFLPLAGEYSLIQETVIRTVGPNFAKPLIVCQAAHHSLVKEQMRAIGIQPDKMLLEPVGRNTAPAAAVAALAIAQKDPEAILLVMPADHSIRDLNALDKAIAIAHEVAKQDHLVTLGIQPSGAETGYGYIQRGAALTAEAFAAARFVEKPSAETARRYIEEGNYYWNSGIFAFRAATYFAELEKREPDLLAHCRSALSGGRRENDYILLDPEPFQACKTISIDYAVMEHTDKAAVVPVEMGWSDVGSWAALWDNWNKDDNGNALIGNILHYDVHNSYLRSDGPLIAALGVTDLIVVATADAVLVSPKSAAQDVKNVVEQLEGENRKLKVSHPKLRHSWGWSELINRHKHFDVSQLTLDVGATLSVAPRGKSVRRWVIASGTARVITNQKILHLKENETYILTNAEQRLENTGDTALCIIELRIGPDRKDAYSTD